MDTRSRHVMTFVMTTQYNGFAYAGFQRQSRTPPAAAAASASANNSSITTAATGKKRKRKRDNTELQRSKNNKSPGNKSKNKTVLTVQDQIETALHKWTNLSISTLRVRGAGRTDKGVHATHQVVAFDVPVSLLVIDDDDDNPSNDYNNNNNRTDEDNQVISSHARPLLLEAYQTWITSNENQATKPYIDQWKIRRAISTRLPNDIVLRSIRIWNGSTPFEARQNVKCKTYIYKLRFRCNKMMHPICNAGPHLLRRLNDQNTVWLSPWPLDKDILVQACHPFVGTHDFSNFVHKAELKDGNSSRPSLVRRRERYKREQHEDKNNEDSKYLMNLFEFSVHLQTTNELDTSFPPVVDAAFTLRAKGFHRSQVRNLVGFVVDVARGECKLDDARALLMEEECDDENNNGVGEDCGKALPTVNSAPACGLRLANVEYEHDDFL